MLIQLAGLPHSSTPSTSVDCYRSTCYRYRKSCNYLRRTLHLELTACTYERTEFVTSYFKRRLISHVLTICKHWDGVPWHRCHIRPIIMCNTPSRGNTCKFRRGRSVRRWNRFCWQLTVGSTFILCYTASSEKAIGLYGKTVRVTII